MFPRIAVPAAVFAVIAASAGTALAQESGSPNYVEPPRKSLELTLGTGYTEGFGLLEQGVGLPSVSSAGIGLQAGIGASAPAGAFSTRPTRRPTTPS